MGGRLTTPPSSASSSSTTTHRPTGSSSTTNLADHPRTHSNIPTHPYQQSPGHHHHHHRHHRSSSGDHHHHHHRHSHGLFGTQNNRHRTTSTTVDPMGTTAFNLNLLRYVGLERDSDEQSSDDDSPQTHRRIQHFLLTLRDVPCPVCNKTIPSDSFDKHFLECLSKPRIDYNEDTLDEDKGECVICLDDLLLGQKIARLPCLCIYHKSCIDNWFRINRTCPGHPGD